MPSGLSGVTKTPAPLALAHTPETIADFLSLSGVTRHRPIERDPGDCRRDGLVDFPVSQDTGPIEAVASALASAVAGAFPVSEHRPR